jgi:hypothetical protein
MVPDWMVRHRAPTRPVHIRSAVPGDKIEQRGNEPLGRLFLGFRKSLKKPVPKGVVVIGRTPIQKRTRR